MNLDIYVFRFIARVWFFLGQTNSHFYIYIYI